MKEKFPLCEEAMVWRGELVESGCSGLASGHMAGAMREARGISRQVWGADSQCEHAGISAERALLCSLLTALVTIGVRSDTAQSVWVTSSRLHSSGAEGHGTDHGSLCSEPSPGA